jgi:hypothetical protein
MSEQVNSFRASIGSVFYRPSAFDNWANKKFNRLCDAISEVIDNALEKISEETVQLAKNILAGSGPSGGHYLIVDKKGKIIDEWTASEEGNPPAIFTGLLMENIEKRILSGGRRADYFEVGVFSNEAWEYKTIAFYGPNKKYPYGRIVVGEGGIAHPVSEYAKILEKDMDRPFLRPAFEIAVVNGRTAYQQVMKQHLFQIFGEKVPVTFRMYFSKSG